jgi:hypothetical protein
MDDCNLCYNKKFEKKTLIPIFIELNKIETV